VAGAAPIQDIITPEAQKIIHTTYGVQSAVADNVNFFASPLGIGTLGIGALPKAAQFAVATGFALQMGSEVPHMAKELNQELKKPEDQRDYKKIGELTTAGALATGFTVLGALGAFKHGMELAGPKLRERAAFLGKPLVDQEALLQVHWEAEEIARSSGQNLVARRPTPGGIQAIEPGRPITEEEILTREAAKYAASPEAAAEARRQEAIRQFLDRMRGAGKPPRPTVPEGPTEIFEPPPEPVPKEFAIFDDFVADLNNVARCATDVSEHIPADR
jgi:hypothetical protein